MDSPYTSETQGTTTAHYKEGTLIGVTFQHSTKRAGFVQHHGISMGVDSIEYILEYMKEQEKTYE